MVAPQYPKGLWLDIFSWKLVGGHEGRDLDEINILNHYIGMKRIDRYDELVDLNWLPIAYGGLALLLLRAALLGSVRTLVDMTVLSTYVCTFALGTSSGCSTSSGTSSIRRRRWTSSPSRPR